MYNLIFGPALFYDIPEYLNIVYHNSFFQALSLGHFPVHPAFLGILWILIRFFPVNAIAMLFGAYSIFLVYKISKKIFGKGFLSAVIFALFPGIWLINTNLMVESIILTFFLLSLYFFILDRPHAFFISLCLMVLTHLESVLWIPSIFIFFFIFEEIKFQRNKITKYIKFTAASIVFSTLIYLLIYLLSGRNLSGSTEQLNTYFSSGFLRMARNSWLSFSTAFGSLILPLFTFLIIKKRKAKSFFSWILFFSLVLIIGANWQGDLMPRRIIFAGIFLTLGIYKYLKTKSLFVIFYLLPITLANIFLYASGSPFQKIDLPQNQVLIQTFYLKPFTDYVGTTSWLELTDTSKIDGYLAAGKRVFLTPDSVTAPYRLLVGNNYHITSLGRVGDSPAKILFQKYKVTAYGKYFELKKDIPPVSKNAGEPVIFCDKSFWGRLTRRRIDYGDLGVWLWAIILNHRDPSGWIYKDASGNIPS